MFYPVDSLKRGGRFYLCWVADSWPLRFAAITHRQLWSQDIRKLCEDLLEVMTNESGRPTNRFSLRLSSQLMRGLVRLYERKVSVFLGDLCMINATVFKHANKKFIIRELVVIEDVERPLPQLPQLLGPVQGEPEGAEQVEELLRNSGNVVGNIQDITLKEAAIPDFQLPPNDGFGEENQDQPLQQLLADRTVEMMLLQAETSGAHHSILELPDVETSHDRSRDKSRLLDSHRMERISEHDVTMFRKSAAEDVLPVADFEKEIPEIPFPDVPAPLEMQVTEQEHEEIPVLMPEPPQLVEPPELVEPPQIVEPLRTREEPKEMELEELEEMQPRKRRVKNKLIIDKKIRLNKDFFCSRIYNPNLELRCEHVRDDIADTRVPFVIYMRRPAHAGSRLPNMVSDVMTRLFQRNIGVGTAPLVDRELEEAVAEQPRLSTRSVLEKIVEEPAPIPQVEIPEIEVPEVNASIQQISVLEPIEMPQVSIPELMDIADLPTQKLETLSQVALKRNEAANKGGPTPKKARHSGYAAFKESQQMRMEIPDIVITEPDKENMPPESENIQPQPENQQLPLRRDSVRNLSIMLQQAGLSDIQPFVPEPVEQQVDTQAKTRRDGSGYSETPLGSLDRTKVSLGDSVKTTDSQRFIRNEWGIEGTMVKILKSIKAAEFPVTVESLVEKGPVISGYKRIIAARCFTSILKLKQYGFLKVIKDSATLEIKEICLGPQFDIPK